MAALPVVVLLGAIGLLRMKAHLAALLGLATALAIAILVFGMPARMALMTAAYGAAYGLFPIGWIILNVIFLYQLTEQRGQFTVLRESIAGLTGDRRLQVLLVAFCFGAFFEGCAGFGAPVAVTGAILIGLGFSPLLASGLSLIANTAPVAFGSLGIPIVALQSVTGLDLRDLSAMVGRQLPVFSVIVPFWLVWAFAGLRGVAGRVAGGARGRRVLRDPAVPRLQLPRALAGGRGRGAGLDGGGDAVPAGLAAARAVGPGRRGAVGARRRRHGYSRREVMRAWVPWLILSVLVFVWGLPQTRAFLDGISVGAHPGAGTAQPRAEDAAGRRRRRARRRRSTT